MTQIRADQVITVPNGKKFNTVWTVNTTEVTISNTLVETNMFSVTIPGGLFGLTDLLIVRTWGSMTIAAAANGTVRMKYGGTTMGSTVTNVTTTGTVFDSHYYFFLRNNGATNAQIATSTYEIDGSSFTTQGTAAIDSTVNQTLAISWQWSVANAGNIYVHYGYEILYIPAV